MCPPPPRLSNATSVWTNYTPSILPHLSATSFRFKYQFHGDRESERAAPLGAEGSAGAKPQITYFLQLPAPDTHVRADRCRIHPQPRILAATDGRPSGRAWETCVRVELPIDCEDQVCVHTKAPPALFKYRGYTSLRTNGDAKQQWHLWQVMIPSPKIWITTYLGHLLPLKSLLLILSSTCVLQQHVPEPWERPGRVTAIDQQSVGAGVEPARAEPDETVSAFICCWSNLHP